MKYLLFTLFFISTMSSACIIGPQNIKPRPELGFDFKESDSDLCVNCSMISINSPKVYDGRPVSHAVISIFQNGEVVFKSVFAFEKESRKAEVVAIINKEKEFSYEVGIEYGIGRCMGYKFIFNGSEKDS